MSTPTFKVVLVGPAASGKTQYANRLLTGGYSSTYKSTFGVEVHPLRFQTLSGEVCFNLWDCTGNPHYSGLVDAYFLAADAVVVCVEAEEITNARNAIQSARNMAPSGAKIVCVLNKFDKLSKSERATCRILASALSNELGVRVCAISARNNFNLEAPFLYLARRFLNDPSLIFTTPSAVEPPEVVLLGSN